MLTKLFRFTVLLLSTAFLSACAGEGVYHEDSGSVFHTVYHIKYKSPRPLTGEIEKEFALFDASLDPFNKESIIAKVNANQEVEVDKWFTTVFNMQTEKPAIKAPSR